jgi:fructose-specific component phosphotransferase system IIB-like protein
MPDLSALIERLEGAEVMRAFRERDPNRPSFTTDQPLVHAVEQATKRRRVTLAEAVSFAEGYQAALKALQGSSQEQGEATDNA